MFHAMSCPSSILNEQLIYLLSRKSHSRLFTTNWLKFCLQNSSSILHSNVGIDIIACVHVYTCVNYGYLEKKKDCGILFFFEYRVAAIHYGEIGNKIQFSIYLH